MKHYSHPTAKLPLILLAEDSPDDIFFMERALEESGLHNPLIVARDGQEAVDYLGGQGRYADRQAYPMPALLLLDLKLPRMTGFDVLAWLRAQPNHHQLKVVVFTSSFLQKDLDKAMSMGADDLRTKSSNPSDLVVMLKQLHDRWLAEPAGGPLPSPRLYSRGQNPSSNLPQNHRTTKKARKIRKMHNPIITTLDIRSWRHPARVDYSAATDAALLTKLEAVAELSTLACTRLARRIMARCAVSIPFRSGANSEDLVTWLTEAGALVVLSSAARPTVPATSVAPRPATLSLPNT